MRLAPLLLAVLAVGAQAQTMKSGLWEIKQQPQLADPKMQAQMEQAQKQMAAMPPEQRKMVEQMMASKGVAMNMSGGTITLKVCISEEQAKRNQAPVTDKGNCTQDSQRSGNTIRTQFKCTDPASEGESEVTLLGNGDGFTNKTRITQQRNGRSETVTMNGEAHWLGSDCGGLKPTGK